MASITTLLRKLYKPPNVNYNNLSQSIQTKEKLTDANEAVKAI